MLWLLMAAACIAQKKELVFATYTYADNTRLQHLQPVAEYLSQKTGIRVRAVSYPTVQALIAGIKNDSVDIAMMNTSGYMVLQRNHPGKAVPFVNLYMGNDSSTNYAGCIIALRQKGIHSLEELTGTSKKYALALVTASSTSGNLVPRLLLNAANIPDAEAGFTLSYSGTHKKVVEDVLNGRADIGGCGCAEVDSARSNQRFDEKAMVIASFNDIPLGPVIYNNNLDKKILKKLNGLFQNIHLEQPAVFRNFCNGWTEFRQAKSFKPVKDNDYNKFRQMFGNNEGLWRLIM